MPYNYFNLQLFGEEGDMAGADLGSDVGFATNEAENPDTNGVATEGEGEQVAPVEEESWDSLIKGKYKEDYEKSVKNALGKRLRNQQDLQSRIDSVDPIIRMLAQRYGVDADVNGSIPLDALREKIDADDSAYEQEAFQRGMSVKDLKQMKQMELELNQIRRQQTASKQQQEWNEIVAQGEEVKKLYPDFNMDAELENPNFGRLLATFQRSGFPNALRTAYETVHRDEIMGGAMRYAVSQTEQKISNSIQSGMRRPSENGTRQQSSSSVGNIDPSKLTKEQLLDIKMRAERGERITF